ncbi:NEDD8 ultimate buster 1-like isoform X2 [Patiria miniata]|uniref:NEDD8 ultimate buster 1 n=1 Tax=Patiria miniata TaxID=46514 RepID=A0A913Z814_PATMI|nr:NEDD8 ultimate buster 1-like isoform X1 [Patiria miniata]XP_038047873.1 NEDD8 ultimate buster 1-like isoform X1 [Patiria miniata]XP_038047875.1 NEDD8 ultimate buster 1-like isoform X2 [Patiria miniata]
MASNNIDDEEAATQAIRQKLNSEKMKLWLPPYTQENATMGVYPEELLDRYSSELSLPKQTIADTFERLRQHALAKLAARQNKPGVGVAKLKIKLTGEVPEGVSAARKCLDLEVELEITGRQLRERIANMSSIPTDHLKLISCGSVIQDDPSIYTQHVRNGSQVLVICLSQSEREARQREERASQLVKTKEAAAILAKRKDGGHRSRGDQYFLQIADQTGKPIDLPDSEREALSVALALNEKGRACLKRKQHGEALLILLEAEKAFSQCRSEILTAVDNYALLCLDIVWCYLCLQNVSELPDAEAKLKICEDGFRRSYGDNLQRLASLKGDSPTELALYVRLYLLQGIMAFYQGRMDVARSLLQKAENTRATLQVDEDKLMQVVSMGFDVREARLGLRAASGNVSVAVTKITEQRQRRKEIREKEAEERKKKARERKLGKTANGEWIKSEVYDSLLSMGFPEQAVLAALKQTNNDLHNSLQVMQEQPDLLALGDSIDEPWQGDVTNEMIAQVSELGFDPEVARLALYRYRGDIRKTVDVLIARGGVLPPEPACTSSSTKPGGASSSGSSTSQTKTPDDEEDELTEEQKQAIADIAPDIPDHEEDHLDLTLEEEARFIQEYKARLASMNC